MRAKEKKRREAKKDILAAQARKRYKEGGWIKCKEYRRRPEVKARRREWENLKKKTDLQYRISKNLRSRVYSIVKGTANHISALKLLGCSVADFLRHIEQKFIPPMAWDNYGTFWEIDHILPCSSFDLTKSEEQFKCFHWSNMQPLEKSANRSKNGRMPEILKK